MSSKNELAQAAEHARLRRVALASDILEGRIVTQDARERGRLLAGPLGEAWASFMVLSPEDQARALLQEEFRGVPWQELLQCSPYTPARRTREAAA